jgi:hypothetical protein
MFFKIDLSVYSHNGPLQSATDAAAILRAVADRLESGEDRGSIRDINDNRVGTFTLALLED